MDNILLAIAYSRYSNDTETPLLTRGEIICCHQYMRQNNKLTPKIKEKLEVIQKQILIKNWTAPTLRYNSEMAIEQLNEQTGSWYKTEYKL